MKDNGIWYVKYFANRNTKAGIPDILACVNGVFVAIEVKASNGRVSELQKHQIMEIRKSGGYAIVTYPDDFDLLKMRLLELKKKGEMMR